MGSNLTHGFEVSRKPALRRFLLGGSAAVCLFVAGCSTSIGDAKKAGSITENGVEYDVYQATEFDEAVESPVFVFVKKGADPLAFDGQAIVHKCYIGPRDTRESCVKEFLDRSKPKSGLSGGTDN